MNLFTLVALVLCAMLVHGDGVTIVNEWASSTIETDILSGQGHLYVTDGDSVKVRDITVREGAIIHDTLKTSAIEAVENNGSLRVDAAEVSIRSQDVNGTVGYSISHEDGMRLQLPYFLMGGDSWFYGNVSLDSLSSLSLDKDLKLRPAQGQSVTVESEVLSNGANDQNTPALKIQKLVPSGTQIVKHELLRLGVGYPGKTHKWNFVTKSSSASSKNVELELPEIGGKLMTYEDLKRNVQHLAYDKSSLSLGENNNLGDFTLKNGAQSGHNFNIEAQNATDGDASSSAGDIVMRPGLGSIGSQDNWKHGKFVVQIGDQHCAQSQGTDCARENALSVGSDVKVTAHDNFEVDANMVKMIVGNNLQLLNTGGATTVSANTNLQLLSNGQAKVDAPEVTLTATNTLNLLNSGGATTVFAQGDLQLESNENVQVDAQDSLTIDAETVLARAGTFVVNTTDRFKLSVHDVALQKDQVAINAGQPIRHENTNGVHGHNLRVEATRAHVATEFMTVDGGLNVGSSLHVDPKQSLVSVSGDLRLDPWTPLDKHQHPHRFFDLEHHFQRYESDFTGFTELPGQGLSRKVRVMGCAALDRFECGDYPLEQCARFCTQDAACYGFTRKFMGSSTAIEHCLVHTHMPGSVKPQHWPISFELTGKELSNLSISADSPFYLAKHSAPTEFGLSLVGQGLCTAENGLRPAEYTFDAKHLTQTRCWRDFCLNTPNYESTNSFGGLSTGCIGIAFSRSQSGNFCHVYTSHSENQNEALGVVFSPGDDVSPHASIDNVHPQADTNCFVPSNVWVESQDFERMSTTGESSLSFQSNGKCNSNDPEQIFLSGTADYAACFAFAEQQNATVAESGRLSVVLAHETCWVCLDGQLDYNSFTQEIVLSAPRLRDGRDFGIAGCEAVVPSVENTVVQTQAGNDQAQTGDPNRHLLVPTTDANSEWWVKSEFTDVFVQLKLPEPGFLCRIEFEAQANSSDFDLAVKLQLQGLEPSPTQVWQKLNITAAYNNTYVVELAASQTRLANSILFEFGGFSSNEPTLKLRNFRVWTSQDNMEVKSFLGDEAMTAAWRNSTELPADGETEKDAPKPVAVFDVRGECDVGQMRTVPVYFDDGTMQFELFVCIKGDRRLPLGENWGKASLGSADGGFFPNSITF